MKHEQQIHCTHTHTYFRFFFIHKTRSMRLFLKFSYFFFFLYIQQLVLKSFSKMAAVGGGRLVRTSDDCVRIFFFLFSLFL